MQSTIDVVLYSADADRRRDVIDGVGADLGGGLSQINWVPAATAPGAIERMRETNAPVVVLDADAPKVGGMCVARDIINELDQDPVIVLLTARPQDQWLATWAGAAFTVLAPYAPLELQETMTKALGQARSIAA